MTKRSGNSRTLAMALPAAGCLVAAPLFVFPSAVPGASSAPALRAAPQQVAAPAASTPSTHAFGLAACGAAAAVVAATSRRGVRAEAGKVARSFFGGGGSSGSYKSFDPASEAGVQDPIGFWDPLGFSADKDEATFKRRRAVEIKHGRIAMYATMGYITPEYFKFPGDLSPSLGVKFADVPNGLAAFSKVPAAGWLQIFFFAGYIETTGFFSGKTAAIGQQQDATQSAEPGNYGVGFPNFLGKVTDPTARASKLNAELANGRLAMVAIIGMFFQDGLTGSPWGDWALYTASPLRAFESELGVQAPVGFWDPLGFAADGDKAAFTRRRAIELKHGRIAMLATMGYITPEILGKFPGFLSPSAGLKYADIPNGLAAVSKVPQLGWAQIFAYCGFVEYSAGFSKDITEGRPGELGWKVLTSADPAEKTKKLSAEIANGRLAMVAIIGMFFQDGLTGSPWGDWALYTASPLRAFESELGVQAPVGFWDPLGFAADGDKAAFTRRRAIELKHGRIAMLATMGYITPEIIGKFPGFLSPSAGLKYADIPNGLAAISKVPQAGWAQIFAYCGFVEYSSGFSKDITEGRPGELGWKVLTSSDPAEKTKKLSAEIANGRLAMMAIIGMFFQDGLTGTPWGDWSLYTASPLRAEAAAPPPPFNPATQVGAMAPLGFFDPAGFSKVGDKEGFRNLRAAELKHGRVAMMAALGGVAQHYIKFPGFEAVPSGVGAVAAAPGTYGFVALFLASGALELALWTQDPNKEVGDFGDPLGLGQYDTEMRSREINNGRFAMFAAVGIIAAELATGKDAIQQWGL